MTESSRSKQVATVVLFLPAGLLALWVAAAGMVSWFGAMSAGSSVVVVHRGVIACAGVGLGLIGGTLLVIAGDFLRNERLIKVATRLLIVGAIATLALPLPVSFGLGRVLSNEGYEYCHELSVEGFRFSRVVWVLDPDECRSGRR